MKIGIPKGLLYFRYKPFIETFFTELGAEIVISPDTNKAMLDMGVKYCVDEACLPIKVFHGHVASIKDKCDVMIIPRVMQLKEREYICPKFCGLPEMVVNSIPDMPEVVGSPLYATSKRKVYKYIKEIGSLVTKNSNRINSAYEKAIKAQEENKGGINSQSSKLRVGLLGHPYNVYDEFINMNVVKKLKKLNVGVITEEYIEQDYIDDEVKKLFKRPFWSFARNSYGSAAYLAEKKEVQGIVYISSFACGIDSVVIDLIKNRIEDFPMLVLKVDEHTGEAGMDTRIEAFVDMLERRC